MTFRKTLVIEIVKRRRAGNIATIMASCLLALLVTPTQAQVYRNRIVVRRPVVKYRHASTIAQGYLDGRANVNRSIGYAQYNSALAARHAQAAYQQQINNRLLRIESYYQAKLVRQKYLDAQARATVASDLISQIRHAALRYRLSQSEYDRIHGTIYWPDALLIPQFVSHRQLLESLFAPSMAVQLGKGSSNTAQVDHTIKNMEEVLGQKVRAGTISSHEFTVASRFLSGLRWEAHYPTQQEQLAASE